jgi:hypothetical protein
MNEKNKNSEIAFKIVRIEGFSIFMERDAGEVSIDEIIGVKKNKLLDIKTREERIYQHIRDIFEGAKGGNQGVRDIDPNDFMLKSFDIDVRLQLTIDKVRAAKAHSD